MEVKIDPENRPRILAGMDALETLISNYKHDIINNNELYFDTLEKDLRNGLIKIKLIGMKV